MPHIRSKTRTDCLKKFCHSCNSSSKNDDISDWLKYFRISESDNRKIRNKKMKKSSLTFIICLIFFLFSSVALHAQQVQPTPPPDDDVVKITTKLVQLDAVVTDKDGNQVRDLSIADFEILQDGEPQKITNFSYINTESPAQSSPVTTVKNGKNVVLPPPARVRSENNGRIVTFIVDDGNCTASQIGMTAAREALSKFIAEQMLPNDLVSIYQTRGGSSLLQQYTSDKTQLMRAARRIRWYPPPGSCGGYSGDFFEAARIDSTGKTSGQGSFETEEIRKSREQNEDSIRDNQAVGTVGVIRYVVRGLGKIGGRKSFFYSRTACLYERAPAEIVRRSTLCAI